MKSAAVRSLLPLLVVVACRDQGIQPPRTVAADSADQTYKTMSTEITRGGVRVSFVEADSAWVYQARQIADLKTMKVTFFDSSGATISTVTSKTGRYNMRDQSLDARGDVVAVSSEGRVLKTPHLTYDRTRNLITSDTTFTSTSRKGNLAGSAFTADPGFRTVTVIRPKGAAKGAGFVIPGQRPQPR
jgi:LPS export ABC transporter protein LptC